VNADGSSPFVRPYAVTGGRTESYGPLAVEALVCTTARGREVMHTLVPEYEAVCRICAEVRSVAEIAALLGVPLGVAGVVVGDLAEHGLVLVESTAGDAVPDVELLERVLSGLENL
jgi:ribulose-5-phosphate 4-epimerase/fuculose-1-phosphate aldolase